MNVVRELKAVSIFVILILFLIENVSSVCSKFHTIKSGDICWDLAINNGITLDEFYLCNPGIVCANLQIGQQVCLACSEIDVGCISTHQVKAGETCYAISAMYGVPLNALTICNPQLSCNNLQVNQRICYQCAGSTDYPPSIKTFVSTTVGGGGGSGSSTDETKLIIVAAATGGGIFLFMGLAAAIFLAYRKARKPPSMAGFPIGSQPSYLNAYSQPSAFSNTTDFRLLNGNMTASMPIIDKSLGSSSYQYATPYMQTKTAYSTPTNYMNIHSNSSEQSYKNTSNRNIIETTAENPVEPTMTVQVGLTNKALSLPGYKSFKFGIDFEVPSIGNKMGLGGTASVYKGSLIGPAVRENHGVKRVAIKAMNGSNQSASENESTGENQSSFYYEVAIMSSFPDHPNVVKFVGYCEKPRMIIMRFYESNLSDTLKRKDVEFSDLMIVKIAYDIANGLSHIHKHGILHLDVKPNNVLFDFNEDKSDFKCVVCDFGVANVIEDMKSPAKTVVSGLKIPSTAGFTVRYAAPEVFEKLQSANTRFNQEIDKKIDVYSYAISLYAVVFRMDAWGSLGYNEIKSRVLQGQRPELPTEPGNPPDGVGDANSSSNQLPIVNPRGIYVSRFQGKYQAIIQVITTGWSQRPEDRPSFDSILKMLIDAASDPEDEEQLKDVTTTLIGQLQS